MLTAIPSHRSLGGTNNNPPAVEHIAALASTPSRPSPRGRQPSLDVVASPITPTSAAWADPPQHPRLAVVLGIDPRYRHPLLACRSLCFCPSVWGTIKCIVAVWRVFDRRRDNAEFGCVAAELWLAILWVVIYLHEGLWRLKEADWGCSVVCRRTFRFCLSTA